MTLEFWFWAIFVLSIIFNGYGYSQGPAWTGWRYGGLVVIILMGILGWQVFGGPVHH